MKRETKKKPPKYVSIDSNKPNFLNIKIKKAIQLKRLLKDFTLIQAGMITDVVFLCKKNQTNQYIRSITGEFSFQTSWGLAQKNIQQNLKKILNKKCPPLIKIKNKNPIFKINYEYFNKLYDKEFKSATEIFNERKLYQDRFLIYCYGFKQASILELILFKMQLQKDYFNLLPLSISKISKELHLSYQTTYSIIKKMSYKLTEDDLEEIEDNGFGLDYGQQSLYKKIVNNFSSEIQKPLGIFSSHKKPLIYIDRGNIINIQKQNLELLLNRKVNFQSNSEACVDLTKEKIIPIKKKHFEKAKGREKVSVC